VECHSHRTKIQSGSTRPLRIQLAIFNDLNNNTISVFYFAQLFANVRVESICPTLLQAPSRAAYCKYKIFIARLHTHPTTAVGFIHRHLPAQKRNAKEINLIQTD